MSAALPQQIVVSMLIEAGLIVLTTLLLAQPRAVFSAALSERARSAATYGGLMLLCITFMWSVIFGMLLSVHQLSGRV
jgi:hypothetical protein